MFGGEAEAAPALGAQEVASGVVGACGDEAVDVVAGVFEASGLEEQFGFETEQVVGVVGEGEGGFGVVESAVDVVGVPVGLGACEVGGAVGQKVDNLVVKVQSLAEFVALEVEGGAGFEGGDALGVGQAGGFEVGQGVVVVTELGVGAAAADEQAAAVGSDQTVAFSGGDGEAFGEEGRFEAGGAVGIEQGQEAVEIGNRLAGVAPAQLDQGAEPAAFGAVGDEADGFGDGGVGVVEAAQVDKDVGAGVVGGGVVGFEGEGLAAVGEGVVEAAEAVAGDRAHAVGVRAADAGVDGAGEEGLGFGGLIALDLDQAAEDVGLFAVGVEVEGEVGLAGGAVDVAAAEVAQAAEGVAQGRREGE